MRIQAGQTLILTGASGGIGSAFALALAQKGLNLVLNARNRDALEAAANKCREAGVRAEVVAGPAQEEAVAGAMVKSALGLGRFAGFIHIAGVFHPGPFVWELSAEKAGEVWQASFSAGLSLARAAYPALLEEGRGLAVFLGSGAAERVQPGIGVYCASKAAEESLARQLAVETKTVCSLIFRPGIVETKMQKDARNAQGGASELVRPFYREWRDQGILFTPEECARRFMKILEGDLGRHHGQVIDAREVE